MPTKEEVLKTAPHIRYRRAMEILPQIIKDMRSDFAKRYDFDEEKHKTILSMFSNEDIADIVDGLQDKESVEIFLKWRVKEEPTSSPEKIIQPNINKSFDDFLFFR